MLAAIKLGSGGQLFWLSASLHRAEVGPATPPHPSFQGCVRCRSPRGRSNHSPASTSPGAQSTSRPALRLQLSRLRGARFGFGPGALIVAAWVDPRTNIHKCHLRGPKTSMQVFFVAMRFS